jgi:phage terminase large subunit-like protein
VRTGPEGTWFDARAAAVAVAFFEKLLHHVKGEWSGEVFKLQPWQREMIGELFGWKRPDGSRRYRRAYIEIPRKNGKSTLAAGIGLLLLFADDEPGAEIYSAAADRDQAAIVFDVAKGMVESSPQLQRLAEVFKRSITVPATRSSYKVLSADAFTKHGLNAHGVIFDEPVGGGKSN